MTANLVILAITVMVQDVLRLLEPAILVTFACVELKYQNLTMIPLVEFAQEEAFVKLGSNQKNVNQVFYELPLWCYFVPNKSLYYALGYWSSNLHELAKSAIIFPNRPKFSMFI